jgi:ribonuclease P protein component
VRDDQDEPRIGFTITRRVGGAVERNRIRRRLRAAAAAILPGSGRAGHDYVIVARRPLLETGFDTILGELRGALERAHRKATGRAGQ